jgi:hypothetical protein
MVINNMKKALILNLIIICITQILFSQVRSILDLQKMTSMDWKQKNPELISCKPSLFTNKNADSVFIFPVNFDMNAIAAVKDCEFRFLNLIYSKKRICEKQVTQTNGQIPGKSVNGEILTWKNKIQVTLIVRNSLINTSVDYWYLMDDEPNYCREAKIFPFLQLKPNSRIDKEIWKQDAEAIGIITFNRNQSWMTRMNTGISDFKLKTTDGKEINGKSMDLNRDSIQDIFWYWEQINSRTRYFRLFININGSWKCRWISLQEDCV